MKYSVAILFALIVTGLLTTGHGSAVEQCPNDPNPISEIRIGTIIEGIIYLIVKIVVQLALPLFEQIIGADTIVPVEAILSQYAVAPTQILSVWTETTLNSLNLNQFCYIVDLIPEQLQNIPMNAAALIEYLTPQLEAVPVGVPVLFHEWSQWVGEFITQSVTSDLVYLFNTIPAL